MKKKKWIIGSIATLVVLPMLIVIILIWCFGVKPNNTDIPLLIYYSGTVLGSFATFYTVVYALFSWKIRNYLYSEEIEVGIDDDNFKEDVINEDATSVTVEKYHCDLLLKNIGRKPIKRCELRITEIIHRTNKTGKQHNLMPKELSYLKVPICGEAKNSLLEQQSLSTSILSIIPETTIGTPTSNEKTPLHLEIIGHNLNQQYDHSGIWNIKYVLQTSDKILKKFEVTLEWTGLWRGRLTEMKNEITIKLN